ncbi:MAG: MlaD family protein [Bacteroidota bacterium]
MSKEFKIGLITIIAGALLYYGFNFLRGTDVFSKANRYYAIYPNVSGLNVSNPVYFDGLPIGRVAGFKLQQGKGRIVVALDIDADVFVSAFDTAKLSNDGLLGSKAVILDPGFSEVVLEVGDTLKSLVDEGMLSQFEPITNNLNSTIDKVNTLLDHLNETDIAGVADTLKYSIGALTAKARRLELEKAVDNANELILTLNDRSEQLAGLMISSKQLVDSLAAIPLNSTLVEVNTALRNFNEMLSAVQSQEGTVGKLLQNDSLYNNLNQLLVDLDRLAIHFNQYPKDFMAPLGRKHKKLEGLQEN